jgi:hypothetical protein
MLIHLLQRRTWIACVMTCGVLLLLASNAPAQTTGLDDCWANFDARHDICVSQYFDCLFYGPAPNHTCSGDYNTCEVNNSSALYNCLFSAGYPGSAPEYQYRTQCIRDCDNLYDTCYDNGGLNNSRFNFCYEATEGDLDVCCDNERTFCIRNSCQ